jgi:hypothetical protein
MWLQFCNSRKNSISGYINICNYFRITLKHAGVSLLFLQYRNFKLRVLHLLCRFSTTWTMPQPFCSGYFWVRVSHFDWAGLHHDPPMLPTIAGIVGVCHHAFFFGLSPLPLVWNCDPPNLSLLHSLGRKLCVTMPSYWLTWGLTNFLSRLSSNHDPPSLSFPSS